MERKSRALQEANNIVRKEEKRDRRRKRLVKARNVLVVVAVAASALTAEYAILNPSQYKAPQPSCAYSPFQIDCTWNSATPTPIQPEPTHVSVPEHEVVPSVNNRVR